MSKVTPKLQLSPPGKIAHTHKIVLVTERSVSSIREASLAGFDAATLRQAERNRSLLKILNSPPTDRGWSREDLYVRRISLKD